MYLLCFGVVNFRTNYAPLDECCVTQAQIWRANCYEQLYLNTHHHRYLSTAKIQHPQELQS